MYTYPHALFSRFFLIFGSPCCLSLPVSSFQLFTGMSALNIPRFRTHPSNWESMTEAQKDKHMAELDEYTSNQPTIQSCATQTLEVCGSVSCLPVPHAAPTHVNVLHARAFSRIACLSAHTVNGADTFLQRTTWPTHPCATHRTFAPVARRDTNVLSWQQ